VALGIKMIFCWSKLVLGIFIIFWAPKEPIDTPSVVSYSVWSIAKSLYSMQAVFPAKLVKMASFFPSPHVSLFASAFVSAYYDYSSAYNYLPNPADMTNEGNVQRVMTVLDGNIKQWSFIEAQLLEPNVNLGMVSQLDYHAFISCYLHFS
jgi:hypothetical protein